MAWYEVLKQVAGGGGSNRDFVFPLAPLSIKTLTKSVTNPLQKVTLTTPFSRIITVPSDRNYHFDYYNEEE